MLLSDDYFVHTHRNHVHKRTFTFNSLVQLTNVYCLTHRFFSIILLLFFTCFFKMHKIRNVKFVFCTFAVK